MWAFLNALLPRSLRAPQGHADSGESGPAPRLAEPLGPRLPRAGAGRRFGIEIAETALGDAQRGKPLPLRATYPAQVEHAFPVIAFSHGAWGSKNDYALLIQHWAAHGYVCLQPSHADALGPQEQPSTSKFREWTSRPQDITLLLDMLGWIETEIPALRGRLDAERIGVAGHSFGAGTAQLIAGARLRGRAGGQQFRDRRVRAALLLSPQGTGQLHGSHSWSAIRIPMMTITGTHDFGRGGGPSWRTEPFHGAPAGNKYLIVIERGVHDLGGIGRSATSFPYAHDARQAGITQRLSLAFWDAHLKGDTQALRFLKGSALEELLGADARVQRK